MTEREQEKERELRSILKSVRIKAAKLAKTLPPVPFRRKRKPSKD